MEPRDAMLPWVGAHVALEVHVVAFLDVVRVQRAAERQRH